MSASREKKTRQDATAQGPTEREQKRQQEAKEAKRSTILYTVVGIVCVVLIVFLLIWNTGMIQRNATAVTVNGVKYTASDVQYYYNSLVNQYAQYGLSSISDTMHDTLVESAVDYLAADAAIAAKAEAEGYTLSDDAQTYLNNQIALLDTAWAEYGYSSQKDFLRANYGPYMTIDKLISIISRQILASDYESSFYNSLEYDDSDYTAYYNENTDTLDSYTITRFVFQARVNTTDDEGNTIEMTEEEQAAALEEAKAQVKATAEELQAKLEAGEDPAALAEAYSEDLYSYDISLVTAGSTISSAYSDWLFDSARQSGDITLAEYDSTTAYNYYVLRFEGRALDTDSISADVRHILVSAETDEDADEPSEEQYAAAKATAEELLAQWQAGEATEDSFSALAVENSADTGSAASGGLISGITESSTYVDSFKDWALDPAREVGETGLVQSVYGWHIMYFVGSEPTWKVTIDSALHDQDYNAWLASVQEGYEPTTGIGVKFVQS